MGTRSITLDLPDELYKRIAEEAEASQRSLEVVAMETLDAAFHLPEGESAALSDVLAELQSYSNAQLWTVAQRRLSWSQSLRLRELSAKSKQEALSNVEDQEMLQLLELVDYQMLLRSEALVLLKRRGQDVEGYLKLGA